MTIGMKNKAKKLRKIQKLMDSFSGRSECADIHTKNHVCFEVCDNEDITAHISALLEVCYYALDGNGMFTSPAYRSTVAESSVTKVLELVLGILPHGQMHCLDRIEEILRNNKTDEKENLP